jgi:dihydrofolate synthase/folylpolyglutamate synthase
MLTYREALETILHRPDFERENRPAYAARTWRLARVEELLDQLGNPHRAYRSVHIAGTKGKGSTTAMIDAILRTAGYRTGMYTSPHLHTFRERIRMDGALIPEGDVARLTEEMLPILAKRPKITVFEIITALAMCYYAEPPVDFGVFEVGLGGRLDATNVLQPNISVITSISMDHVKVLGNTLEAIAREKAGIIKAGIPVITAPQRPEAMRVIRDTCEERGAPLTTVGADWRGCYLEADYSGQRLSIYRDGHEDTPEHPNVKIPLLGAHQLENACVAMAAVEALAEQGVAIDREAIRQGLGNVDWPGRMEILGLDPIVLVDGAHNPYSVQRLLEALPSYLAYRRIHLVFGASRTHNPQDLLALLLPQAHSIYVTQADHPKAMPTDELCETVEALGGKAHAEDTMRGALGIALAEAQPDDLVLVTGSLFVVAEAREAWAAFNDLPPFPSDPPGVY